MAAAAYVLGSIVAIGGAMRDLIDKWYRVPQILTDLDTRLESLHVEQQIWEAQVRKFGLVEDQGLKDIFDHALSNLQELESTLETKKPKGGCGSCGGCLAKLKWSVFPAELQEIVNRVTGIFGDVLQSLKNQIEIEEVLQKKVLNSLPSLECRPDLRRYVRLERTCEKVMVALRNSGGPSVVLLHGGPGTGKSSLATDVAVQFRQDIVNRSAPTKPQTSSSNLVFEQVVFLECGPHMDLQAKQSELREKLGWSTSGGGVARADSDSDIRITKTLYHLLSDRKLLVILDDIWNSGWKFLQTMIDIGGKNVKWFITSQLQGLCNNLNCEFVPILMEDAVLVDARRILAVHIGLQETVISEVKDFMDPIIHKVKGNLLALTCTARAIDPTRYSQKREWVRLEKELSDLLDTVPKSKFQSKEYGRSYWEAVQVGFDRLSLPEQNLIFLMYMCKGPSINEKIIEYLFKSTKDKYQSFSEARSELQGRDLVKVTPVYDSGEGGENTYSWSIHFLLKEFIKRKYFLDNVGSKMKTLDVLSNRGIVFDRQILCKQESNILISMIALYFEKEFAEELFNRYSTQVDIPQYAVQRIGSRDYVIEPVAQLLIMNEGTEWTPALCSAIQRVFLEYSQRGVIDQDGTSTLLAATASKACMLAALSRYHEIEPYSFFGQIVVSSLVQHLETECICAVSGDPSNISSRRARYILNRIAYQLSKQLRMDGCKMDDHDKHRLSKVFEQLKDGFLYFPFYDLKVSCAYVVGYLGVCNNYISKKAVTTPGLLEGLLTAFQDDSRATLQTASVFAIARLTSHSTYVSLAIVSCTGILEALVAGVQKEDDEKLQYICVIALSNLAFSTTRIVLEIVNCTGALEALATGLNKEKSERLEGRSALAFHYLAMRSSEAKWKIIKLDGVLDYLVSAVGRVYQDGADENTHKNMMEHSAGALWQLAAGGDAIRAEMMFACPGIVHALTDAVTTLWNGGPNKMENDRGSIIREIMHALTLLDPGRAKAMGVDSAYACWGRGFGTLMLGQYQEAVKDFDTCEALLRGSLRQHAEFNRFLCCRGTAKAKAGDLQGALADANLWVEMKGEPLALQQRGITKRMMGDLHEALRDLDGAIAHIDQGQNHDYEICKHRGFVKYLLHDEESAQIDAHQALQAQKDHGNCIDYNSDYVNLALGYDIVKYLDFEL